MTQPPNPSRPAMTEAEREAMPFVCRHQDPRCEEDPCPWGIARFLCNAPADHPARANQGTPA